jgi:NTE family protein
MRSAFLALIVVLCVIPCRAQQSGVPPAEAPPPAQRPVEHNPPLKSSMNRPKIGVALEGGGALGLAHIGVLQWFEEHHIPIDYLAGTSMGGMVGGFYATGKSAEDLRSIVKKADWPLLLSGEIPYPDLAFRRKQDERDIPNSFLIGLRNGPVLPPGLNSGHEINLLIDRETLPYSSIRSFNDLPIPFRCVSTELVSGKPYVFHEGSLSNAMRATMSIPGVFSPVREDDKVFVDGGLVDNLPTDVVRSMGADVVIAVHLQLSKTTAKEIQSAFSVLGRSVELIIAETELRGMSGADLLISVGAENYSTMDYDKAEALTAKGYAAAEAKAQVLRAYELDDAHWAEYQNWKQSRRRGPVLPPPQFIQVQGADSTGAKGIQEFLEPVLGKPLDTASFENMLTRLTGVGRYDSVTYEMIREGTRNGLLVQVQEKNYAPPQLQPYIVVDGTQTDDVTFTIGGRLTFMDVAGYRSEWRTDIQVGRTYGLQTELYRPFAKSFKFFVAPFLDATQTTFLIYAKSDPRADYRLDQVLAGGDVGYSVNRFSEIRAGYGIGYYDATLRLGTPEFASAHGRVGAFHLRYVLDHTNEAVIPTKGYYLRSNFQWIDTFPDATEAYPTLVLYTQYFRPLSRRGIAYFAGEGGTTFGYRNTGDPPFFLGGVGRLSAYGLNELLGNQYFVGRFGYRRKIFTLPPFVGKQVYVSTYAEVGKIYGDPFPAPRLSGDLASGLLAETAFGPVFIGGSVGDSGHQKWFFQLGRVF